MKPYIQGIHVYIFSVMMALVFSANAIAADTTKEALKKKDYRLLLMPMNESSGTKVCDISPYHLHATLFSPKWVKDPQRGYVLQFDGTSTWGMVPPSDSLNSSTMTFAVWVKADAFTDNSIVISKRIGTNDGFLFGFDKTGAVVFSPTRAKTVKSDTVANAGEWVHVAVVYDGNKAAFYINGNPAGEKECGSLEYNDSIAIIGSDDIVAGDRRGFKGCMSDLRALSITPSASAVTGLV
ncbi:MAG: LamG domain-containing protein, partial [Planctomycetes bacterium]|nr:LamG domain-containing protein [Planctomycetota bacterium]